MKKLPKKEKRVREIKGWVEITEKGEIVFGKMGLKMFRYKKDILAEGFSEKEVALVLISPLNYPMKLK